MERLGAHQPLLVPNLLPASSLGFLSNLRIRMLQIRVEVMTASLSIVIKIMDCLKNALDARAQHEATPPWINLYRDENSLMGIHWYGG